MKVIVLLCAAISAISCVTPGGERAHNFVKLREQITKKYQGEEAVQRLRRRSAVDFHQSLTEFRRNIRTVDDINADSSKSFSCEYNEMSIKSDAERQAMLGLQNITEEMLSTIEDRQRSRVKRNIGQRVKRSAPSSVDWVKRKGQGAIKNQGRCGSCWAFGAASSLEGTYYAFTGEKKIFGEQEYLDCTYEGSRDGCKGGIMSHAYDYNKQSDRMAEESDAPYVAKDRQCEYGDVKNGLTKARVTGTDMHRGGDTQLEEAVIKGVVTVAIHTTGSFQQYREGVYVCTDDECNGQCNHAVSVVGYSSTGGMKYWNVRNSWGSRWGDGGYIKMTRDGNILNIHYCPMMPRMECRKGQTCDGDDGEEEATEYTDESDESKVDRGKDIKCGNIVHSGGRCLSIDDSSDKYLDLSEVCERTWCITDLGFLYEQATDLCVSAVTLDNKAKTKLTPCNDCGRWDLTDNDGIQETETRYCMYPAKGGKSPKESTNVVIHKKCPTSATKDDKRRFTFKSEQCWEMEAGMKLSGSVKGSSTSKDIDAAKEACMENDDCGGVYYSDKKKVYKLRSGDEFKESKKSKDLAFILVNCTDACKDGEKRCDDGDCKQKCDDDDEDADGCAPGTMRCNDGQCRHEHMCHD